MTYKEELQEAFDQATKMIGINISQVEYHLNDNTYYILQNPDELFHFSGVSLYYRDLRTLIEYYSTIYKHSWSYNNQPIDKNDLIRML